MLSVIVSLVNWPCSSPFSLCSPIRCHFSSHRQNALHADHLLSVLNNAATVSEDLLQGFHNALKAAFGTLLLSEACDGKVGFTAMFEHGEKLDGKRDRTDMKSYQDRVSLLFRRFRDESEGRCEVGAFKRTVLLSNSRPDPPSGFVDHDVSESVLPPFAEGASDLLPRSHLRDLEAHDGDGRLDPEESCKPILGLRLYDARWRYVSASIVRCSTGMLDGGAAGILQSTTHIG